MNRFDSLFFQSKFARDIFLLFVSAAILPVVIIALLSFNHISNQLREQSYEQSRLVSKAVGMELYRRLKLVSNQIDEIGKICNAQSDCSSKHLPVVDETIFSNLSAIGIIFNVEGMNYLRGDIDQKPILTSAQEEHLTLGKTVIISQKNSDNDFDILLVKLLDQKDPRKGRLIGKVSPEFLRQVESMLPNSSGVATLNPSFDVLYSSQSWQTSFVDTLKPLVSSAISGHFEWSDDESKFLASFWSVFTDTELSIPYLVVVVSQPESDVLASINDFRSIYAPMLLLSILLISLVAVYQIRKKLAPVLMLRDATQCIASGDFSAQVCVSSDDEIGQLGEAFNSMANKLGAQFTSLSTMAEIDQLILSSFDAQYIIETVLGRAGELTPCVVSAVVELENECSGYGQISSRLNNQESGIVVNSVTLTQQEISNLNASHDYLQVNAIKDDPSYLVPLLQNNDASSFLIFPVFIKQCLSAAIIFGYNEQCAYGDINLEQLRKFSDHVAVALSNAKWEERLYHQAHYDPLTDLPNRALLQDRLEQAIARAQRNKCDVGVLFLDLDRFKLVNDTLGHTTGDLLLRKISDLLMNSVRNVDTIVRFGGDEFVIIIPDLDRRVDVVSVLGSIAENILALTRGDLDIGKHKVHTEMSIGISICPKDGMTPDELIKCADTAMYHAKEQGRGCYKYFSQNLNTAALQRMNMGQELRRALNNNEFLLNYQPKVDCVSGKLVGAEALIRWLHPERGLVQPYEFISYAEEYGLIQEIGEWALKAACQQAKAWCDAGLPMIRLAVNVSPRQFEKEDFVNKVAEILKANKIDPKMLELEVTESAVMKDANDAIEKLNRLNALGVYLSIDDFGTGFSSLSYLRKLPVHALKIDKSFADDMTVEPDAEAIVSSIIYMAHQLGLGVVAEGVERDEQKVMLQKLRCDEIQGYLISKPVTHDQFKELLIIRECG